MAETMKNPAMIAMVGPIYGHANYDFGSMVAHQMLLFTALTVGIMSIIQVTRHTRKDEEEGRIEMIRSLPVGKLANISATLVVYFIVSVLIGLVTGVGFSMLGIESMPIMGSMLYGAVLAVTGFFFAVITSLFAQLFSTSRATVGYGLGFLILSYIVRGIGDVSSEALARISPLGLILRAEVYVNNYWWPIFVLLGVSLIFAFISMRLAFTRDLEAGLFKAKAGKEKASKSLLSPLGLAFRLQKTTIIAWLVAVFVLGASYGSVFGDMDMFFKTNDLMRQILPLTPGVSLVEQFMSVISIVSALVCAIPAIQMITKLRSEEKLNRTDHILGRAVSRKSLLTSYVLLGFVISIVATALSAYGLYLSSAQVMEEPIRLGLVMQSGLVHIPAIWVMIGIAVLLIGIFPKAISFVWGYLTLSFILNYFDGILQIPEALKKLTPFAHIPQIPVDEMTLAPLIVLTFISAMLIFFGYKTYSKRDISA
jgi:ABC-2 type transport system permease protein